MSDRDKTKEQLIQELEALRMHAAELEAKEADYQDMEAALKEAGTQYQNLFELAGESIFVVDAETYRILAANTNAARRLGYSRDELTQLNIEDVEMPADDNPQGALAWTSRFSRTRFYECNHKRRDGTLMPVEVSSRLIRRDDRAVLLNFARDITQRKQLEAERERLIVELDAYAHTVAHDLKSPLAIIIGYCDLLLDTSHESSKDDAEEWLGTVKNTGLRMRNIIDELLVLASVRKMEDIHLEILHMPYIIHEALARLSANIANAGAEVVVPDEWPSALGYAPWIEEMWANYISNAVKYGGEPPLVELGSTPESDNMVRFWVRDNGPGITPEEQTQLFSQFTRLDETRAKGHGLGLSIVQRIAEKLGGEVGVESNIGEGSVFSFTLPVPD